MSSETQIDWTVATQAKERYEPMVADFKKQPNGLISLLRGDDAYREAITCLFDAVQRMRRLIEKPATLAEVPRITALYWEVRACVAEIIPPSRERGGNIEALLVLDGRLDRGEPFVQPEKTQKPCIIISGSIPDELLAVERWALIELNQVGSSGPKPLTTIETQHAIVFQGNVNGNVVQTLGDGNRFAVDRSKRVDFWAELWRRLKRLWSLWKWIH
jgi:hypothetical protein